MFRPGAVQIAARDQWSVEMPRIKQQARQPDMMLRMNNAWK